MKQIYLAACHKGELACRSCAADFERRHFSGLRAVGQRPFYQRQNGIAYRRWLSNEPALTRYPRSSSEADLRRTRGSSKLMSFTITKGSREASRDQIGEQEAVGGVWQAASN